MISEVCVVTESPMLAIELQEAVEDERICFEHVSSGERAITRAVCGCSTAILVDEDPSDMSPAGLLRQLSNSERGRDTLVILLSSRSTEIDRVIAFELGADDYVPKPIGARELSLRVSAVLRRHRDERLLNHKLEVGPSSAGHLRGRAPAPHLGRVSPARAPRPQPRRGAGPPRAPTARVALVRRQRRTGRDVPHGRYPRQAASGEAGPRSRLRRNNSRGWLPAPPRGESEAGRLNRAFAQTPLQCHQTVT